MIPYLGRYLLLFINFHSSADFCATEAYCFSDNTWQTKIASFMRLALGEMQNKKRISDESGMEFKVNEMIS